MKERVISPSASTCWNTSELRWCQAPRLAAKVISVFPLPPVWTTWRTHWSGWQSYCLKKDRKVICWKNLSPCQCSGLLSGKCTSSGYFSNARLRSYARSFFAAVSNACWLSVFGSAFATRADRSRDNLLRKWRDILSRLGKRLGENLRNTLYSRFSASFHLVIIVRGTAKLL